MNQIKRIANIVLKLKLTIQSIVSSELLRLVALFSEKLRFSIGRGTKRSYVPGNSV